MKSKVYKARITIDIEIDANVAAESDFEGITCRIQRQKGGTTPRLEYFEKHIAHELAATVLEIANHETSLLPITEVKERRQSQQSLVSSLVTSRKSRLRSRLNARRGRPPLSINDRDAKSSEIRGAMYGILRRYGLVTQKEVGRELWSKKLKYPEKQLRKWLEFFELDFEELKSEAQERFNRWREQDVKIKREKEEAEWQARLERTRKKRE